MTDDKAWIVAGYKFSTQKDVKLAQNELIKIQKIEEKLDYHNVKMIKLVYDKTLESGAFKTQVGFDYLKKLQVILLDNFPEEEIKAIPINQIYQLRDEQTIVERKVSPSTKKKTVKQIEKYKYTRAVFLNIFLILLIVGMFIITTTSKNPNIINYERTLQNKYASWEEELQNREKTIRVREKELLLDQE